MAKLPPCDVITRTGRPVRLRSAVPGDARRYLAFLNRCLTESEYLIQTADELRTGGGEQRAILRRVAASPRDMLLLAQEGGAILGALDAVVDRRRRLSHVVTLGLMVDPDRRGSGVGSALLERFLTWARDETDLEKAELHVHAENDRALELYARFGFLDEGRRRKAIKYHDGRYMDDVLMGLDLGAAPV